VLRLVVKADEFGPRDQVDGGEHALQPRVVFGHRLAGQVAQAHGFGLADAVFDPGVLAVAWLQFGDRPIVAGVARSGGEDERGVTQPRFGVEDLQLRPGVGPLRS
jgi:hypothetical protein